MTSLFRYKKISVQMAVQSLSSSLLTSSLFTRRSGFQRLRRLSSRSKSSLFTAFFNSLMTRRVLFCRKRTESFASPTPFLSSETLRVMESFLWPTKSPNPSMLLSIMVTLSCKDFILALMFFRYPISSKNCSCGIIASGMNHYLEWLFIKLTLRQAITASTAPNPFASQKR